LRAPALPRAELEELLARIGYARSELLDSVADLPDAILDWSPPRSAFSHFDAWAPEVRTIRNLVQHALQLEAYYVGGLQDGPSAGVFEPVSSPEEERARTLRFLQSLSESDLSRVYEPLRPSRNTPEQWTVRKVMRRLISHDRVHAAEVRQRTSWLLLGVPRLENPV
jgi:uncharacterized damage-inducible protein DinB